MGEMYEPLRLSNQLCFPIYLCAKELVRKYGDELNELGLTYTQYIVMMYFWEVGSSNVKDIGAALLLDPSTLTPILKKLEAKGLITRRRLPEDERNLTISLTETGEAAREKALGVPAKMYARIGLNDRECETLRALINKVLENVEKENRS
ncbi:MAG: MarR family transcriptional regulator [Ruminiclostridium sp.]|nr:MarR family transcriptional regulator [Ruminiclostridium sp.]